MSNLTAMQERILTLQESYDTGKKALDVISKDLETAKSELLAHMVETGVDSFKNERGTITLNRRFQVTVPKGDDLESFFGYLEKTDERSAHALRTVNYATLNSWYKEQLEAAGDGAPFLQIPGLQPPTANEYLSVRRK